MKSHYLLICICIFIYLPDTLAQHFNRLTVEVNMARYGEERTLFLNPVDNDNYFSFFNGFELGYQFESPFQVHIGGQNVSDHIYYRYPNSSTSISENGLQVKIGAEYTPWRENIVSLNMGIELFGTFSKLKGYMADDVYYYQFDHRKRYFGFAPEIKLNVRIWQQLYLVVGSRMQSGIHQVMRLDPNDLRLYPNRSDWITLFEPLSTVAVRFDL